MGDLDKLLARAEVLSQIIGVLGDLSFNLLMIYALTHLNKFLLNGVVEKQLWGKVEKIVEVFRSDEQSSQKKDWSRILFQYGVVMLVGFSLGYVLQSNYFTGQITLLITTSRIANYYKLLMWGMAFLLQAISLLALSMLDKLVKRGVDGKMAGLFKNTVRVSNYLMLILGFALVIGCVVVCYASVGSQF